MLGQAPHEVEPVAENVFAAQGVGTDADRAALVIQHDHRVGMVVRQVDHLVQLRVVHPRIEDELAARQFLDAGAEPRVIEQAGGRQDDGPARLGVRMPGRRIAYPTKAPVGGFDVPVQDGACRRAQRQVDIPDDARGDRAFVSPASLARPASFAVRGDARGLLGFSQRGQRDIQILAIVVASLDGPPSRRCCGRCRRYRPAAASADRTRRQVWSINDGAHR